MTIATSADPAPSAPTPRKKSSLIKKLFKLFAVFFILFILVVVLLFLNLNTLVRAGVVRGGHYATDQNTDLSLADLSLSAGSLHLAGFDIGNLKGYSAPKILAMKSCTTTVQSSSVFSHTVIVDSIVIDGLDVTLEQNGLKNNLNELMDIIKKKTASTGDTSNSSPGKELKIGVIKMTGSKVHILAAAPLNLKLDIDLPDLELTDPTNPDGRPMKIADLVGQIFIHLSKQIVENPQIPGGIKDGMKNVTALVDNLRGQLEKNVKQLGNLGDLEKKIQDVTKDINPNSIKDATKGLQNLLGGNKNNPPK